MTQTHAFFQPPHLLVIDQEEYWCCMASKALTNAGLSTHKMHNYDLIEYVAITQTHVPNLVVLGCTQITDEERDLIKYIKICQHHVLVLCLSLPWSTMRELFKLGVDDVTEKPYHPHRIVEIVQSTMQTIAEREDHFVG